MIDPDLGVMIELSQNNHRKHIAIREIAISMTRMTAESATLSSMSRLMALAHCSLKENSVHLLTNLERTMMGIDFASLVDEAYVQGIEFVPIVVQDNEN